LRDLPRPAFTQALVSVYASLNYFHPFPEGNGRSTQVLLSQLAVGAGYHLDFAKVTRSAWNTAAAVSVPQRNNREPGFTLPANLEPMLQVFTALVVPHPRDQVQLFSN
jgi:cell filamentation protein